MVQTLQFPNDKKVYLFYYQDEYGVNCICKHPDEKEQRYVRSKEPNPPFKYLRSKNPLQNVVEELKTNGEEFWYRSNKNFQWLKLRTIRKERDNNYGYDVYFPNDTRAYKLTFLEGFIDLECINPDSTRQIFYRTNVVNAPY